MNEIKNNQNNNHNNDNNNNNEENNNEENNLFSIGDFVNIQSRTTPGKLYFFSSFFNSSSLS